MVEERKILGFNMGSWDHVLETFYLFVRGKKDNIVVKSSILKTLIENELKKQKIKYAVVELSENDNENIKRYLFTKVF